MRHGGGISYLVDHWASIGVAFLDRAAGLRVEPPFVSALGDELRRRGHGVSRIRLCMGDRLFWPGEAHDYRGSIEDFGGAVRDLILSRSITDVLLFGDCRPYHQAAICACLQTGAR